MSDLLDEAHEFLLCMDKMEYADALFALRAELTEARRQLKEADSQKCIASIVPDGTTHIRKTGRRSFAGGEYALYFECFKNDGAQWLYYYTDNDNEYPHWRNLLDGRYRNPDEVISSLVSIIAPVPQPAVPDDVAKDASDKLALAYGYLWHVNNMRPGYDAPVGHSRQQLTPEKAAYKARAVLRELLTNDQRGDGINRADAILSATDSEGRSNG